MYSPHTRSPCLCPPIHVVAAIARVQDSDENVIAKLVRACGRESPIPMIMGSDALQVIIDGQFDVSSL